MNPNAIATLAMLLSTGLIITIAIFGIAVYKTVKTNRNTDVMNRQAQESQEAFAELNTSLAALN